MSLSVATLPVTKIPESFTGNILPLAQKQILQVEFTLCKKLNCDTLVPALQ